MFNFAIFRSGDSGCTDVAFPGESRPAGREERQKGIMQHFIQSFASEAGTQEYKKVFYGHDITMALSGSTSDNIDIQVCLNNPEKTGATWYTLRSDVLSSSATYIKTFEGSIQGIRLVININSSGAITFEILAANRRG